MSPWTALRIRADDPVGGSDARRAAQRELSRPEYRHDERPGFVKRAVDWISHRIGDLFDGVGSGGGHVLLILLVVVLVGVVLLAARAGFPTRRSRTGGDAGPDPLAATNAVDHRRLAQGHSDDGRYAEALREWLRATVATIEERGILPARPGRTGAATAREAGPVLPSAAADLTAATTAFDQVWFGGRAATPADVAVAKAAADEVRAARPRRESDTAAASGLAAPW